MKLPGWLKGVVNVAGALVPGVAQAATIVNAVTGGALDPQTATGGEVLAAYEAATPEQQAAIDRRAEVEIAEIRASVDKLDAMVSVETPGANTRPQIALMMAWVVTLGSLCAIAAWSAAIFFADADALDALTASWPLLGSILAAPVTIILTYFGKRSKDKVARYAAATHQPIGDAIGGIAAAIRRTLR